MDVGVFLPCTAEILLSIEQVHCKRCMNSVDVHTWMALSTSARATENEPIATERKEYGVRFVVAGL